MIGMAGVGANLSGFIASAKGADRLQVVVGCNWSAPASPGRKGDPETSSLCASASWVSRSKSPAIGGAHRCWLPTWAKS